MTIPEGLNSGIFRGGLKSGIFNRKDKKNAYKRRCSIGSECKKYGTRS